MNCQETSLGKISENKRVDQTNYTQGACIFLKLVEFFFIYSCDFVRPYWQLGHSFTYDILFASTELILCYIYSHYLMFIIVVWFRLFIRRLYYQATLIEPRKKRKICKTYFCSYYLIKICYLDCGLFAWHGIHKKNLWITEFIINKSTVEKKERSPFFLLPFFWFPMTTSVNMIFFFSLDLW